MRFDFDSKNRRQRNHRVLHRCLSWTYNGRKAKATHVGIPLSLCMSSVCWISDRRRVSIIISLYLNGNMCPFVDEDSWPFVTQCVCAADLGKGFIRCTLCWLCFRASVRIFLFGRSDWLDIVSVMCFSPQRIFRLNSGFIWRCRAWFSRKWFAVHTVFRVVCSS